VSGSAVQVGIDLLGLAVLFFVANTDANWLSKQWLLAAVIILTLAWDLVLLAYFYWVPTYDPAAHVAAGTTPPAGALSNRRVRHGLYWIALAALLSLFALAALFLPLGWDRPSVVILVTVFVLAVTVLDVVTSVFSLKNA